MARGRGRRTDYSWGGLVFSLSGLSASQVASNVLTITSPSTLMRCRGRVRAFLETATAADSLKTINCGIIVGDDDQLTAGSAAFPSPGTDMDAEWIWQGFLLMRTLSTTEADNDFQGSDVIDIDSKAMRRLKQTDNIVFVAEPFNLTGTETADVIVSVRCLLGS